eukprot:scaffold4476_cov293-Chaetoceros_neogracile.AAC.3
MTNKYMHRYNSGECRSCGDDGRYEENEETKERTKIGELMICSGCKSVQYCCREHQVKDWPKHKKFCKGFRKLIVEYRTVRDNRPHHSPKPAKPTPYPLHDIIHYGDYQDVLQYLINHPTCDVNGGDDTPDVMSPLSLACNLGKIECVEILLDYGATFTNEDAFDQTPLMHASYWGHDDIAQLLIDRGADVNQTTTSTYAGFALDSAVENLQPHMVEFLIRHGANIHQRQADTEAGADINARTSTALTHAHEGDTALNLCCDHDNKIKVVKLLISSGALLDVQRKTDGRNALLNAAGRYDIGVVELLIRAGADTTLRDSEGRNYIDLLKHA